MADDNLITATTRVDTSGLSAGMDQANAVTRAGLTVLQTTYAQAASAVRAQTKIWIDADQQAREASAAGHAALAAQLQTIVAGERATLDTLAVKQNEVAASVDAYKNAMKAAVGPAEELAVASETAAVAIDKVSTSTRLASITARAFAQEAGLPMGRLLGTIATQAGGLGPILNAAFPYVAALGLVDVLYHLYERYDPLIAAVKAFDEEAKKSDEQLKAYAQTIRSVNRELNELHFGKAAGDALDLAQSSQQLQVQRNLLQIKENEITAQQALVKSLKEGGLLEEGFIARTANTQKGSLMGGFSAAIPGQYTQAAIEALKTLQTQKAEIERQIDEATQKSGLEAVKIQKELLDQHIAANNTEIAEDNRATSARSAAARRKAEEFRIIEDGILRDEEAAAREEKRIQTERTQEFRLAEDQQMREEVEAGKNAERIWKEFLRQARERINQTAELAEMQKRTQVGVSEAGAKGAGDIRGLQIEHEKLDVERQYGLQVTHTQTQQVQYLREIAALDAESRAAKQAGLQADLQIAAAELHSAGIARETAKTYDQQKKALQDQETALRKIVELENQIGIAAQQNANKGFQEQTKVLQAQQQQYQQFFNQLQQSSTRAFDAMITGQKGWQKQWEQVWNQSVLFVVNTIFKQLLDQFILNNTVMAAAQKATNALLQALHLEAKADQHATDVTADTIAVTELAGVAAATAYAAYAANPPVALIMAADAFATTLSLGIPKLETGTNYVPAGGMYELHQGEAVVPKQYNPAVGGSSGGHSFHYHAAPGASASQAKSDTDQAFAHFKKKARQFNR